MLKHKVKSGDLREFLGGRFGHFLFVGAGERDEASEEVTTGGGIGFN